MEKCCVEENEAMTISKKDFLKELNKDLEYEYAAAIQYVQHSAAMGGAKYGSIQKELLIHSDEEMQHAKMLSEQIDFLEGVPTMEVEERFTDEKTERMLELDLEGEQNAIDRYKERIAQAEELREYGLRRVLEDILIQEEEHKRDLLDALEKE